MNIQTALKKAFLAAGLVMAASSSHAALTPFQTYTGNIGYSSAGWGSTASSGSITALVPAGSTVISAFLYTTTTAFSGVGGTLNGSTVAYTALPANGYLQAGRADVTSAVKSTIDAGPGGVYTFDITETRTAQQDGEALVVVYSNPTLATATFALLDGYAATAGDTSSVNFDHALDPTAPGFFAEMFIGDGYSYGSNSNTAQSSTIAVNGTVITNRAGGYDDGQAANGALISVGGWNDPFSPYLPLYEQDHERYDLSHYIQTGDTTIAVRTNNPSGDDNIFVAGFFVSGVAAVNAPASTSAALITAAAVPEPATMSLAGLGALGLGFMRRRRKA